MAENTQTVTVEPVIITDENGVSVTVYTAQDGDKRGENEGAMLAELIYNTALGSMDVGEQNESVHVVTDQLEEVQQGEASEVVGSVIEDDGIWRHPRAANRNNDILATKALLQIIKLDEIQEKLNTKKFKKKTVWNEIARRMAEVGFVMQDRAAERCFQKFRNLEYRYKEYIQSMAVPGKVRRSPPEFMDELEELFGDKYTVEAFAESDANCVDETGVNNICKRVFSTQKGSAKRLKLQEPLALINYIREEQKKRDIEYFASQERYYRESDEQEQRRFQDLKQLLEKQHKERMAATYSLIKALKGNHSERDDVDD